MVETNRERMQKSIEDGLAFLKELISYLLLPLAVFIICFQEVIGLAREKIGLKKRTLEGKVVLITGASSGIGESLARSFYLAGCHLILTSRRTTELERVKRDLVRLKTERRVHIPAVMQLDVSDFNILADKCTEALKIHGKIDILINNAGLGIRGTVLETTMDVQQKIMAVNYFGALAITKELLPQMISMKTGNIVFIGSVQGLISIPHRAGYAASKHALQALADSLRAELSTTGVKVTMISPGYVRTEFSQNSVTATGNRNGKMEPELEKGFSPDIIAERTLNAIISGQNDVVIAQFLPNVAIFIRHLMPNLYFYLMGYRASKTN